MYSKVLMKERISDQWHSPTKRIEASDKTTGMNEVPAKMFRDKN